MMVIMDDTNITTLEQVRQVLASPGEIAFKGRERTQRYAWIESVLKRLSYFELKRGEKGLIGRFLRDGAIRASRAPRNRFPKYTRIDHELPARTDNAHGRLSGPATSASRG